MWYLAKVVVIPDYKNEAGLCIAAVMVLLGNRESASSAIIAISTG